jgi:hypothetical protein
VHSSGDVAFDPSLPLDNVDAQLNAGSVAYGHTFGILGRSANMLVAVPYVWGDVSGDVKEEARAITRSGFGDPRLRLAVNLAGGPALTPAEFAARTPRTTLGASLTSCPGEHYRQHRRLTAGLLPEPASPGRWSWRLHGCVVHGQRRLLRRPTP